MERRNTPRVSVGINVHIKLADQTVDAIIMNLSLEGMFLKTPFSSSKTALLLIANTQHHEELHLQIILSNETCKATGKVAWRSDLGFGIDFTNINEEFQKFIMGLIEADEFRQQEKADLLSTISATPVIEIKTKIR